MAIVLNFSNYSVSSGTGKGAIGSAEDLENACTLTQLNRFAESILGNRFQKGTLKPDACKKLYNAMAKSCKQKTEPDPDKFPEPDPDKFPEPDPDPEPPAPVPEQTKEPVKRTRKKKEPPAPTPKQGNNDLDSIIESINEETEEILENLSLLKDHVADYKSMAAQIKEAQKEKIAAAKNLAVYL